MKLNSYEEAIADYERITGENFKWKSDLVVYKLDSHEFMLWKIDSKYGKEYFWIDQTYGHMKNFIPFIIEMCRLNNIEWVVTATCRNPKAFIRKYGFVHLKGYDYEYQNRKYSVLIVPISYYLGG